MLRVLMKQNMSPIGPNKFEKGIIQVKGVYMVYIIKQRPY